MLPNDLQVILFDVCHLQTDQLIVVGVSGGPDSLCLLDTLHKLGFPLVVAHFDHQLRADSAKDADQVRRIALERDLPFELGSQDVSKLAAEEHLSIEEAARSARYRFLFSTARRYRSRAVAVGHTADDQVETVLMHLLRGAGLAGLKGMRYCSLHPEWDTSIPLVRPLLDTWRTETLAYCQENDLRPLIDPTNQDTTFYRNRLRHELVPTLEKHNPQIKPALIRMTQSLKDDYDLLQQVLDQAWRDCVLMEGPGFVTVKRAIFLEQPVAAQRAVVRAAVSKLIPSLRDFDFAAVERTIKWMANPPGSGSFDLAGGVFLFIEGQRGYLATNTRALPTRQWPQVDCDQTYWLNPEHALRLSEGWQIHSRIESTATGQAAFSWDETQPFEAWLDLDALSLPLQVRCLQPGDRFHPLGMAGHSLKLSDFFINVKLPQRARKAWPLVCSGAEIAWIPGYRPGEQFRLRSTTRQVLYLRLAHVSEEDEQLRT